MTPPDSSLDQLETALRPYSHGVEALSIISDFVKQLGNTRARAELLNSEGALITRPIDCDEAKSLGLFPPEADFFWLLAGDIISTERAFSLDSRVASEDPGVLKPRFIVGRATCDLIPDRGKSKATLYEVHPIWRPTTKEEETQLRGRLGSLLSFKLRQFMYLPPLPGDPPDVIANVIDFDDTATIRLEDLLLAERLASLSLPGSRIFSALLRINAAREGEYEAELRLAFGRYTSRGSGPGIQA